MRRLEQLQFTSEYFYFLQKHLPYLWTLLCEFNGSSVAWKKQMAGPDVVELGDIKFPSRIQGFSAKSVSA